MKKLVVIAMAALFTAGAYAADVAIPTSAKHMNSVPAKPSVAPMNRRRARRRCVANKRRYARDSTP